MEKLLKVADMRALEKQVLLGEISYSRMIEIINQRSNEHNSQLLLENQQLKVELDMLNHGNLILKRDMLVLENKLLEFDTLILHSSSPSDKLIITTLNNIKNK